MNKLGKKSALDRLLYICKHEVLPHDYDITEEFVDEAMEELETLRVSAASEKESLSRCTYSPPSL